MFRIRLEAARLFAGFEAVDGKMPTAEMFRWTVPCEYLQKKKSVQTPITSPDKFCNNSQAQQGFGFGLPDNIGTSSTTRNPGGSSAQMLPSKGRIVIGYRTLDMERTKTTVVTEDVWDMKQMIKKEGARA